MLPLLIAGDLLAVAVYRRHCSWPTLLRLLPGVLPGMVLGAWFLAEVDDALMRRAIGVILLGMTAMQLWQRRRPAPSSGQTRRDGRGTSRSAGAGIIAGFTTMTANAGGPVMTLYLVLAGLPVLQMLGTGAWFFLAVNLAKVPVSTGLDLITVDSLVIDLVLVPPMLAGGALGVVLIRRIGQGSFERAALGTSALASALLLV